MKQHLVPAGIAAVVAPGAIAAGAPANTVLIVLRLPACPVMTLMMMRGMGGHDTTDRRRPDREDRNPGDRRGVS
ncbi:DUF2933 domain-containing protein [Nonomuraea sp. B12E4]|uniref:DUF2933 domain-containing protein n=1 Tax=Nonomuraea sp. B12E4 TaxID=3153564 RepID=UPI00325F61C2